MNRVGRGRALVLFLLVAAILAAAGCASADDGSKPDLPDWVKPGVSVLLKSRGIYGPSSDPGSDVVWGRSGEGVIARKPFSIGQSGYARLYKGNWWIRCSTPRQGVFDGDSTAWYRVTGDYPDVVQLVQESAPAATKVLTSPTSTPIPIPAIPTPVPCRVNVVVVSGDTLSGLAHRYLGDASRYPEIMAANGLSTTAIRIGQHLCIR